MTPNRASRVRQEKNAWVYNRINEFRASFEAIRMLSRYRHPRKKVLKRSSWVPETFKHFNVVRIIDVYVLYRAQAMTTIYFLEKEN